MKLVFINQSQALPVLGTSIPFRCQRHPCGSRGEVLQNFGFVSGIGAVRSTTIECSTARKAGATVSDSETSFAVETAGSGNQQL